MEARKSLTSASAPCEVQEIVQYICLPNKFTRTVDCSPLVRLFKVCSGQPAVEITKLASIAEDGQVILPDLLTARLPVGKPYSKVVKHNTAVAETL
ncbi:hypothetical protein CYLTODRAFT_419402 [Cylindrobasidium torrendii FP15055 ss-10]|uniref:Uncharacterized protein n=1 Tax=Cylindrobasidium torrendii FP15055 ss-10 TaxID=1314674 RepID=A0A0D7BKW7_9AGAR|nr:hypothetical protein CYLTODRAFT_419402 [Cylindrobasidium torrendii FP15055 ss-10]